MIPKPNRPSAQIREKDGEECRWWKLIEEWKKVFAVGRVARLLAASIHKFHLLTTEPFLNIFVVELSLDGALIFKVHYYNQNFQQGLLRDPLMGYWHTNFVFCLFCFIIKLPTP